MSDVLRLNVTVSGRVQGVGFRLSARACARQLGLTGWVRNMPDGERVEAVAEGPQADLMAFLEWCHKGPALSQVTRVVHDFSEPLGAFTEFDVRF